jgi:uncharacterized protein (DUF58 family)
VSEALVEDVPYLDYSVRWRTGDQRPGKHAARQAGTGGNFRAYRPFWQMPDARHIDVRRSIVDPAGEVIVRQMEQRSSIVVVLAADVSRSMMGAPMQSVAALAQAAARSATRAGDSFGVFAFDEAVRHDIRLSPSRARGAAASATDGLRHFSPVGRSAAGISNLASMLPSRRCLLLLASDFLMPLDLLDAALTTLSRHDVAPIILGTQSRQSLPRAGLLRLRDLETGAPRLMLMRPALHRRSREAADTRQRDLQAVFERHGRTPFHAAGAIDIAQLSQHLMSQ